MDVESTQCSPYVQLDEPIIGKKRLFKSYQSIRYDDSELEKLTKAEGENANDSIGEITQPAKRQKVVAALVKREGSLSMGDTPLYLRNCVVIEGDLFWKVVWQGRLIDSFQMEIDFRAWNTLRFDQLRNQALKL